ncbi:PREDICTED: uncharacterized protein LOC108663468 [Theobroma cacao]|uniref:Uncharacterized protein LOC108663468 n=1 Tax=Theobroma cacao TaxID=3641 RepID=A0AB32X0C5_THECC|nr:PREDICTED: uncharacterized protein LOC108663468 [Theobroma cacao]
MAKVEDWSKNADTHKMSPEEVRAAGVEASKRPPGHHPGEVLHQRRKLPAPMTTMTIGGLLITAAVGYSVLYYRKKREATALDVAKVATGVADPEDTHPRK